MVRPDYHCYNLVGVKKGRISGLLVNVASLLFSISVNYIDKGILHNKLATYMVHDDE